MRLSELNSVVDKYIYHQHIHNHSGYNPQEKKKMAETKRDMVQATINDKTAKYVNADDVGEGFATVATVRNVEERKNINGVWISTGRTVTRATVYFDNGTFTRTKSKHVIATIGALADEPINIDGGFAVVINKKVKFGKEPTLYANGKTYDVLTMDVVEE